MIDGYLSTKQAAARFGLSDAHIRRLLEYSKVKGVKTGRDWLVEIVSMEEYVANRPKPGRRSASEGR